MTLPGKPPVQAARRARRRSKSSSRPSGPSAARVGGPAAPARDDAADRGVVDRLDAAHHVGRIERRAVDQHVLRHLLAARPGAFQRHQQAGLHLRLGARQLAGGQPVGEPHRLVAQDRHQLGRLFLAGAGIDAEQPAVAVAVREGMDRVDEAALLAHFLEQPGRHAAAERGRQHRGGVIIGVVERNAGKPEHEVQLLEVAVLAVVAAGIARRLGRDRPCRAGIAAEQRPRPARRRGRGRNCRTPTAPCAPRRNGRADSRSTASRGSRRMISGLPSTGRPIAWSGKARSWKWSKMMSSGVSFACPISCRMTVRSRSSSAGSKLECSRMSARMSSASGSVLLQHLGVIGGALARGIGVEVAADRLDLLGDGEGAAALGALERHVLEEMRDAVDLRRARGGCRHRPRRRATRSRPCRCGR